MLLRDRVRYQSRPSATRVPSSPRQLLRSTLPLRIECGKRFGDSLSVDTSSLRPIHPDATLPLPRRPRLPNPITLHLPGPRFLLRYMLLCPPLPHPTHPFRPSTTLTPILYLSPITSDTLHPVLPHLALFPQLLSPTGIVPWRWLPFRSPLQFSWTPIGAVILLLCRSAPAPPLMLPCHPLRCTWMTPLYCHFPRQLVPNFLTLIPPRHRTYVHLDLTPIVTLGLPLTLFSQTLPASLTNTVAHLYNGPLLIPANRFPQRLPALSTIFTSTSRPGSSPPRLRQLCHSPITLVGPRTPRSTRNIWSRMVSRSSRQPARTGDRPPNPSWFAPASSSWRRPIPLRRSPSFQSPSNPWRQLSLTHWSSSPRNQTATLPRRSDLASSPGRHLSTLLASTPLQPNHHQLALQPCPRSSRRSRRSWHSLATIDS